MFMYAKKSSGTMWKIKQIFDGDVQNYGREWRTKMVKHVILWTLKDELSADSKVRPYTKIRSCLDYEV